MTKTDTALSPKCHHGSCVGLSSLAFRQITLPSDEVTSPSNATAKVWRRRAALQGSTVPPARGHAPRNLGVTANNRETGRSWMRTVLVNGVAQQHTVNITRKLDAEGRVLEETDALGFVTKMQYNAGGQITSSTDPQGRQTSYGNGRSKQHIVDTVQYPN